MFFFSFKIVSLFFFIFLQFIFSFPANFLINPGAESESISPWYTFAGGPQLKISNLHSHSGKFSFLSESRTQNYHGPTYNIKAFVDNGKLINEKRFTFSVWVKHLESSSKNLQLNIKIIDGKGTSYILLVNSLIAPNSWTRLISHYIIAINGDLKEYQLYVTSSTSEKFSFYTDDFFLGPVTDYTPPTSSDPSDFIKRLGKDLVSGADKKNIFLKGMNLFLPTDSSDTSDTIWEIKSISIEDFQNIKALGFNSVRLCMNYKMFEDDAKIGVFKQDGWAWLDRVLEIAKNVDVKVLLDMHAPQGGYQSDKTQGFSAFWGSSATSTNTANQNRLIALWTAIAQRYKHEPIILGYDLINEPRPYNSEQWYSYAEQIIKAIRSVDPWHLIDVEVPFIPNYTIRKVNDENILYDSHNYVWEYSIQYSEHYKKKDIKWGKYDPINPIYVKYVNGVLSPVSDSTTGSVPFDKNYLRNLLKDDILNFCNKEGVPANIGEYGLSYQAFNYDVGSVDFMKDFNKVLDGDNEYFFKINSFYFAYHGSPFSIYTNWNGYETNDVEINKPLKEFFKLYLNPSVCDINCISCESNKCIKCKIGFLLLENKCYECNDVNPLKCKTCSLETAKCEICVDGYYLDEKNICQLCGIECLKCESNKKCTICKYGFTLKEDLCIKQINNLNCKVYNEINAKCEICLEKFFLNLTGNCENCKENCLVCDSKATCNKCSINYLLDNENNCNKCGNSSLLKCTDCSSEIGKCKLCLTGYYLNENGLCLNCGSNCIDCDSFGKCIKCPENFLINGNDCLQCGLSNSLHCQNCTIDSIKCDICSSGYFIDSKGKCLSCGINCLICDSFEKCTKCKEQEYYLNLISSTCEKCIENCKSCDSFTKCKECKDPYTLQGDICISSSNCSNTQSTPYIDYKTKKCTACSDSNLVLISENICVETPPLPEISNLLIENFKYSLDIDCKANSKLVILIWSAGSLASKINGNRAEKLFKINSNEELTQTEKSSFLYGLLVQVDTQGRKKNVILTPIKNSGEMHSFKLFCQAESGAWGTVTGGLRTQNNKAKSIVLNLVISRELTKNEKKLMGENILKSLKLTNKKIKLVTNDGQIILPKQEEKQRILEENKQIQLQFTILPDYTLPDVDYAFSNLTTTIEQDTEFKNIISSNLIDIKVLSLNSTLISTIEEEPVFNKINWEILTNEKSIKLDIIQNIDGRLYLGYYELNKYFNSTEKVLDINVLDNVNKIGWNESWYIMVKNVEKTVLIKDLKENTSYQIYYYGENNAVPVLKTDLFGKILNIATESLYSLKRGVLSFGLILLAVLIN